MCKAVKLSEAPLHKVVCYSPEARTVNVHTDNCRHCFVFVHRLSDNLVNDLLARMVLPEPVIFLERLQLSPGMSRTTSSINVPKAGKVIKTRRSKQKKMKAPFVDSI